MACGILVPQAGIRPTPPALGAWSLNYWTAREVPIVLVLMLVFLLWVGLLLLFHWHPSAFPFSPALPAAWTFFGLQIHVTLPSLAFWACVLTVLPLFLTSLLWSELEELHLWRGPDTCLLWPIILSPCFWPNQKKVHPATADSLSSQHSNYV